jgi:hypothetical protein
MVVVPKKLVTQLLGPVEVEEELPERELIELVNDGRKPEDGREPVPVGRNPVGAVPVGKGGRELVGAVPVGKKPVPGGAVPERLASELEKKPPVDVTISGLKV